MQIRTFHVPSDDGRGIRGAFEKLASGRRINRAADDASGLAIGERLKAIEAELSQGERNLSDGASLAAVAEGGLSDTSDLLGRMRELSVQAQNGTLDAEQLGAIQSEYDSLAAEVTRVSSSTSFNGQQLLDGSVSGSNGIRIAPGSGESLQISLADHSATALGVGGLNVSDPATLDSLDQAIDTTSASRARVGAIQNRFDHAASNSATQRANTAAARSRIADTDVAKQVSDLTRERILDSSRTALRAHAGLAARPLLNLVL